MATELRELPVLKDARTGCGCGGGCGCSEAKQSDQKEQDANRSK